MNFWDSVGFGVIIGALISGVFTLLAQRFATRRQKEQFAHDLQVRREQCSHEKEQEIRGRRTEALAELQILLEAQSAALENLWGWIHNPHMLPELTVSPKDAYNVLRERGYRIKLWPINVPISQAVNEYAPAIHELRKRLKGAKLNELVAGDNVNLDVEGDLEQQFQAAAKPLETALKETAILMSELNDIRVNKMINQQAPVEED